MIQREKTAQAEEEAKKSKSDRSVSRRASTVIALMEMGVTNYDDIADACGVTVKEVKQIDSAEDGKIRTLATKGTPAGTYLQLAKPIRCPRCSGLLTMVPCVACDKRWDDSLTKKS